MLSAVPGGAYFMVPPRSMFRLAQANAAIAQLIRGYGPAGQAEGPDPPTAGKSSASTAATCRGGVTGTDPATGSGRAPPGNHGATGPVGSGSLGPDQHRLARQS